MTLVTFDEAGIKNQILTRLGEKEISDFDGDLTKAGIYMRRNYAQLRQSCLTKTAWRFATSKWDCNKLSDEPENRWSAAWQLPPDLLKHLFVYPPGRYEIQGNRLFSNNTSSIEVDYIRFRDEGLWPPWFVEYVVTQGVKRFRKGITGKATTQDDKDQAKDAETDALFQDAQQQPNQEPLPNPFVDCRH